MSYTKDDILAATFKLIDYENLRDLLETDLNIIAQELIDDPQQMIEFKVFLDSGEFNAQIEAQAPGEGQGFFITPVMLYIIGGDFSNQKGPQVYNIEFETQVFGFERDKENLRKILETYAMLNQGKIDSDESSNSKVVKTISFPSALQPMDFKGMVRMSYVQSLYMTYIFAGQLFNDIVFRIDNEPIELLEFNLDRKRIQGAAQMNTDTEAIVRNTTQSLILSITFIFDKSLAAIKVLNNLRRKGQGLSNLYAIEIEYPDIEGIDNYTMTIIDGSVYAGAGGYLMISANFSFGEV